MSAILPAGCDRSGADNSLGPDATLGAADGFQCTVAGAAASVQPRAERRENFHHVAYQVVVDLAADARTGTKHFLLVQSFMPAQDMHILRNPGDARGSPWYDAAFGEELHTPEWTFRRTELMRFNNDEEDP